MDEERKESSGKIILHIYPSTSEPDRTITEHYTLDDSNINRKRHSAFNLKVKQVVKSCKKKLGNNSRKYPRSTREHTDFNKCPYKMTCPNCLGYIETIVYYYNTRITHTAAASLSPICMCMVPYCIKKFKNAAHYCPRCKIYLGTKFGSGTNIFLRCIIKPKICETDASHDHCVS